MKVKVLDTWYDSNEQPLCIQITEQEQKQIGALDRSLAGQGKYAVYSEEHGTPEEILKWMAED